MGVTKSCQSYTNEAEGKIKENIKKKNTFVRFFESKEQNANDNTKAINSMLGRLAILQNYSPTMSSLPGSNQRSRFIASKSIGAMLPTRYSVVKP